MNKRVSNNRQNVKIDESMMYYYRCGCVEMYCFSVACVDDRSVGVGVVIYRDRLSQQLVKVSFFIVEFVNS